MSAKVQLIKLIEKTIWKVELNFFNFIHLLCKMAINSLRKCQEKFKNFDSISNCWLYWKNFTV